MPTDPLTLPEAERDRLAATKVLGWEAISLSYPCDGFEIEWKLGQDKYVSAVNFQPSGDASADYLILRKVRETWSMDDVLAFSGILYRLWKNRHDEEFSVSLPVEYEPGDYRDAALLVLAEKGEI